jgi:hypothetical protein
MGVSMKVIKTLSYRIILSGVSFPLLLIGYQHSEFLENNKESRNSSFKNGVK